MNKLKIILPLIMFLAALVNFSCENEEEKYYRIVSNDFNNYCIEEIKETIDLLIPYALALKIDEEKSNAKLAEKMWKFIDPTYDSKKTREALSKSFSEISGKEIPKDILKDDAESSKWTFWKNIATSPNKYIAKIRNNDIFLKYEISTYKDNSQYFSAVVELLFGKDERFAFLKIFYIYTPTEGWKQVDYEFSWPHKLSKQ